MFPAVSLRQCTSDGPSMFAARLPISHGHESQIIYSPAIIDMLKAQKTSQNPQPNHLVFTIPNSPYINDRDSLRYSWTQVIKAAGVIYRKPYPCLITAASHALAHKEDYVSVVKALGHSLKVLHDHYANCTEGRSVINALELIQGAYSGGGDHE
jgi:hypothetical protein